MMKKCGPAWILWALVLIGALNWGLVGAFNFNLVNAIFGSITWLERAIYVIVGLAAIGAAIGCRCKSCKADMPAAK